jgi:hypothetical protein
MMDAFCGKCFFVEDPKDLKGALAEAMNLPRPSTGQRRDLPGLSQKAAAIPLAQLSRWDLMQRGRAIPARPRWRRFLNNRRGPQVADLKEGGKALLREARRQLKRLATNLVAAIRTPWFFLWSLISLTWISAICIFLPSVGSQVNFWVLFICCIAGLTMAAFALLLLHWIDHNLLTSLEKAAPIGAMFIAIFALFGYLISAQREARRPFLEKQLQACAEIADTVGTLANEGDPSLSTAAYKKFWAYRWGRLSMFEDPLLEQNMDEFNDILWMSFNSGDKLDLHQPALSVARTCRAQAQVAWSVVPGLMSAGLNTDPSCGVLHANFSSFCKNYQKDHHPECETRP